MDDPIRNQSHGDGMQEEGIPEALRRELVDLYAPAESIEVPGEVDEQIARMARWKLSERVAETAGRARGLSWAGAAKHRRVFPVRLVTMTAAAAAILLAAIIAPRLVRTPTPAAPGQGSLAITLPGDVDADGHVDIVDALVLSKFVARDAEARARLGGIRGDWDLNADGTVDERDALSLRERVVKLEGGAG